jgi:thioredoxin 1
MSRVVNLTTRTFVDEVVRSEIPVLVDFWAPWCPPCVVMASIVERIANAHDGVLRVGKVNVDDDPMLAELAGVESIPFLLLFRDGRPVRARTDARQLRLAGDVPRAPRHRP